MTRYLNWPLAISPAALAEVEQAIQRQLDDDAPRTEHVTVELQNIANEARAMLQKPGLLQAAPSPINSMLE